MWTQNGYGGDKLKSEVIAEKHISLRGEISRIEVAEAIGISVSALAMYEQGNRIPGDEIKIKLADFYCVPIQDIFFNH